MEQQKETAGRTHTPIDRARIACNALRAQGVEPSAAALWRMTPGLRRSEAESVIAEYRAAIAKATGA